MKKPDFLNIDTDSWKSKVDQKILAWTWTKTGMAILVSENLLRKLAISQEGIN